MTRCQIILTANSGIVIECNGAKVFCDALHRKKTREFSTVDEKMQLQMLNSPNFKNADAMIFTHKHPDHYSNFLITQAKKLTPDAVIISPVDEFQNQVLLYENEHRFEHLKFSAEFIKLTHDGKEYTNIPNYGYYLNFGGFTVLNTGDSSIADPTLIKWLENKPVDLALLNFPWLTIKRGRDFIEQHIKPRHLMFFHIPFEKDNISGFREACFKSVPLMKCPNDVRLLCEPFQIETIE